MTISLTPRRTVQHNGKEVPICDLETIDFSRLLSQEPEELNKLLLCCQDAGFFYLDLQGVDGRRMLDDHQRLLALMRRFFNSPHDEKNEIGLPSQEHGYEPVGNHAGVVEDTKDGYEILKVSRDEISTRYPNLPSIINNDDDIKTFSDFIAGSNIITKTMLSCLSTSLGLTGESRFETSHRNEHKSNSTLAMFRYLPGDMQTSKEIGHQKHTDIGSFTLLFSEQWGLQVLPPGSDTWGFVEPREGHAVINVGDSLRFASGHKLYSCIHQVVPFNNTEDRYSVAYFLRPESEAKYLDSQGRWVTASQWHDEKYDLFKATHADQRLANSMLVGGMEA
ncbi:gibberellin 20-oxidase family protein [Aspergillus lucknowensis]|uniref:Gibberellin 20-oxidase family protein n=1 Tax=Aspergillus lucknowensis TaxID=176173 RepID=A0ABR4LWX4_9EURO